MGRISDAMKVITGAKALPAGAPSPDLFGLSPGRQRIANRHSSVYSQSFGGSDPIDWVMDCVDLYASTAAHADYYFEDPATKQRLVSNPRAAAYRNQGHGTADPDLVRLFDAPSRASDYTELIYLSMVDYLLAGEFIWLFNQTNALDQPKEVYRVPPSWVEVVPGRVAPQAYLYHPPGGEEQTWTPTNVLHVKRPNPHDPWRGLSVIAGNPTLYDISLSLDQSIAQYYETGTRLTGVLESERSIPDGTWNKIKRQFFNLYSGGRNAYKVAGLERGIKFNPISGNADQAQFATAQDAARDRIAAAFKVPTPLLGDVGGSTDRQAVREAQRIFDNKVMRPMLDSIQKRISAGLTRPGWNVDFCIEYQYVMPIEDKLDLATNMALLPVTADEVRRQIDLDPLSGDNADQGNKLMVEPGTKAAGAKPPPNPAAAAPYPAGAAGRGGQPTTADAQKALRAALAEGHRRLNELKG
jgi:HK97 family phage portal protein